MSKPSPRVQRVADQIQRILADLIMREIRDPRLGLVSVTGVDVSRDFSYATVYVTVMMRDGIGMDMQLKDMGELDRKQIEDSLDVLNRASGFLRGMLGKEMSIRTVPQLKFRYDESIARGRYLSSLIDQAVEADSHHPHDEEKED